MQLTTLNLLQCSLPLSEAPLSLETLRRGLRGNHVTKSRRRSYKASIRTNNEAEYEALLALAQDVGASIFSDSAIVPGRPLRMLRERVADKGHRFLPTVL